MPSLTVSDESVLEHLAAEIDSIKVDTGSDVDVSYKPEAWTREGRVD